jgi:hydrogenase nickel incorporation protein HypA/HybF
MHEYSLACDIKNVVEKFRAGKKLLGVSVEAGSFSGVAPAAFDFNLQAVLEEAYGPGIKIAVTYVPAEAKCACGNTYTLPDLMQPCPQCGGWDREMARGKDIFINSIEVEE